MNYFVISCLLICSLVAISQSVNIKNSKFHKNVKSCPNRYGSCNLGKDGMINVHIVPHTHDDVGWLKTVDQYYYGSNTGQQEASVQYILDNVVTELAKDPTKRFVYVEIAFFWRWWNEQNDETKQLVRTFVDEGRLEFIIGAWCMNDEASTYYNDIIDQQTLGLQFILSEFGECARPKVAWQIDPFGHSREQASLFAQFGFDGLFLGRIDYQDDDNRNKEITREMIWQASENLGDKGQIFTGILPNVYGPPDGFCFDTYCGDEPMMDDPNLDEYNVNEKVDKFINYTIGQRKVYKTNNLIMTMGSDFQYSNAHMWFKNLDKLIYYVNQRQLSGSNINIFYSTTSCYLYSLYKTNITWPVKTDDFFPYAHRPHSFWTGYFTSRAALKNYVRRTNNFLQAVRHLSLFAKLNDDNTKNSLNVLSRAMGVAQHHDAVSGTERQHVANDYAKRLSIGTDKCVPIVQDSYSKIFSAKTGKPHNSDDLKAYYCSLLNITECLPLENAQNYSIIIYNPLARSVQSWIRIPLLNLATAQVLDLNTLKTVPNELVAVYNETKNIPERKSNANYEILFRADLPALSFVSYFVQLTNAKKIISSLIKNKTNEKQILTIKDNIIIKNNVLRVQFDQNGNMLQIDNLDTSISTKISQSFCYYASMPGNNSDSQFQASGAYIFRPNGNESCLSVRQFTVTQGEQFSEIHQIYNEWISQTIRVYLDNSQSIEFDWQIGPINVDDEIGKEIIVKFLTDLDSKSTFYTDSNGREILKRVRDFRPSWPNFDNTEPVSGNYYPINSRIFIRDEANGDSRQLTLVTDRTQGGSSITDGSIEVMLHRRVLNDDSLGVSEPLNEPGYNNKGLVVKGKYYLTLNATQNSARLHRELAHRINMQPLIVFGLPQTTDDFEYVKSLGGWSAIKNSLPNNVHLLSLMQDPASEENNAFILRLEHFYELNEDQILSQPATVNLLDLFNDTFTILGVEELGLGANINVDDLSQRLKFTPSSFINNKNLFESSSTNFKSPFLITLNPFEIKTFRLWYDPSL